MRWRWTWLFVVALLGSGPVAAEEWRRVIAPPADLTVMLPKSWGDHFLYQPQPGPVPTHPYFLVLDRRPVPVPDGRALVAMIHLTVWPPAASTAPAISLDETAAQILRNRGWTDQRMPESGLTVSLAGARLYHVTFASPDQGQQQAFCVYLRHQTQMIEFVLSAPNGLFESLDPEFRQILQSLQWQSDANPIASP